MNFHWAFFRKPAAAHIEPRYYAATKAENEAARQRRADIRCELAVYVATTPREQRHAETEAYIEATRRAIQQAERGRG